MNHQLISFMIFVPLIGAIIQAFLPSLKTKDGDMARWVALVASLSASLLAIAFLFFFSLDASPDASIGVSYPWVGSYSITYNVAIDGMNALLVLLVAIVFPSLI